MRLTLLPVAFFATCLTAAAAQPGTLSTIPTHKAHKVVQTAPVAKTTEATATRMKLQPGQEAIKVSTGHPALQSRQMIQSTASSQPEESDDPPYGTLLATLVLMAAIALRRSKTGRP